MFIKLRLTIFILLASCWFGSALGSAQIVSIAVTDYPPLIGKESGLMNELVKESFSEMGIECQFEFYPLSRIAWSIQDGKKVAALGSRSMFFKQLDKSKILPVDVYKGSFHFFYLKKNFPNELSFNSLVDLKKYKIGYIQGGLLTPLFQRSGIKPIYLSSLDQKIQMLKSGRIDMYAASELVGWKLIQEKFPVTYDQFSISKNKILSTTGDIVFAGDQKKLKKLFLQGYRKIKKNGKYHLILKKYFGNIAIPKRLL